VIWPGFVNYHTRMHGWVFYRTAGPAPETGKANHNECEGVSQRFHYDSSRRNPGRKWSEALGLNYFSLEPDCFNKIPAAKATSAASNHCIRHDWIAWKSARV
jgi:hypothetical protein